MEYTMNMNDAAYDMAQLDELNDNYVVLLDYLNSPNFRSFGDGLKAVIRSKTPIESAMTPQEFLQACCKDKGITVASTATLYNWFHKGMRPDRAEQRREAMFALAFALELTVAETRELFHKVYLDRAFNKRSYKELIYYHCLKRGNTYSHAQKLISLVSFNEEIKDATVRTELISQQTESFADDMDLLAYIHNRPHNFSLSNVAAIAEYEKLWERAKRTVSYEMGFISKDDYRKKQCFEPRVRGNWDSKRLADFAEKDINSAAFDFEIITGQSITGAKGTKPLSFKNKYLPKEIAVNFPVAPSLGKNPSYEQIRKMIVLLFSYEFWFNVQEADETDYFFDYTYALDQKLEDIGYPPLYPGNPFDWLFLTCSNMERPLDAFRAILDEVLNEDVI